MVGWRSTTLALAAEHCPRALDFYEAGAPYDRSVFAVGTAAHAVLEEIGKATAAAGEWLDFDTAEAVARTTCERLISDGRDFEGEPEPPLPPAAVWQGRDLAMAYQNEFPLPADFRYEEGLAVNRDWQPCPYDAGAWLRCRIDGVGTVLPDWWEDDQGGGPILEVVDYKSAWPADARELRTLQRKIQAVLAWQAWGDGHEALRLRVVNFRMRRDFDLMVFPGTPEGARVMERWQADIVSEIKARERQRGADGRRPAAPGAVCYGCPYLFQCDAAASYLEPVFGSADPHEAAIRYAVLDAAMAALNEPLKAATAHVPYPVYGGWVGTLASETRELRPDAAEKLAALWNRRGRGDSVEAVRAGIAGLLQALRLGVAQAESLLKHMFRGSEEEITKRERALAELLTKGQKRRFGVHRIEEAGDA